MDEAPQISFAGSPWIIEFSEQGRHAGYRHAVDPRDPDKLILMIYTSEDAAVGDIDESEYQNARVLRFPTRADFAAFLQQELTSGVTSVGVRDRKSDSTQICSIADVLYSMSNPDCEWN
jgi:hypothetical protein